MKRQAALLLVVLFGAAVLLDTASTSTSNLVPVESKTEIDVLQELRSYAASKTSTEATSTAKKIEYEKVLSTKDALLEEIRTLSGEDATDKIQDELARVFKAEAQKSRSSPKTPLIRKNATKSLYTFNNTDNNLKNFLEDEDTEYTEVLNDEDEGEDEDEDEDEDEEYDDDEDEEGDDLDLDDNRTPCPDFCTCIGEYATPTTAKCSTLGEGQIFGPGIAHLKIENGDPIRLGPRAFVTQGLVQLESIAIVDTRIIELDRTAFDGIPYLFAINLTRNGLGDIAVDIFQNKTQLSLLTISGNNFKHSQIAKSREYLLDAPSVTELDFSDNSVTRFPPTTFAKMPNLVYINLKNNKLRTVEKALFASLDSLIELDLSNNWLQSIPIDLFDGKGLQTLKLAGNNLTTVSNITASKLTTLDVSNNRIKIIHKDDLIGLPYIDRFTIKSNGLKRIHQHAFSQLHQLTYLDISDNDLPSLSDHHLRLNWRLQVLLMNDNPDMETLPVFKTSGQDYSLFRFECTNCGLYDISEGTFDSMPAITRLHLARNYLTGLPKNLFKLLSSLNELDLSDNRIKVLESNMFHGATTLTNLNLAGNLLVTLQVTPFLATPNLSKLDVSRCGLERVWSEARIPLTGLRYLSIRGNRLQRITMEELRATPQISGLDISRNPLNCDQDFNDAIEWLTKHGVTPAETLLHMSSSLDYIPFPDYDSDTEGFRDWKDLAKVVCDGVDVGPPPRPKPHKPIEPDVIDVKNDMVNVTEFDHGQNDNKFEDEWPAEEHEEYEDYATSTTISYHPFIRRALWPVLIVIVVALVVILSVAQLAVCLAKRKGRGPVIRPPMILRQGLVDNKNCGLVYKPLQEEIATPNMPKRGSFYSSSTFHYDKIVPESV